MIFVMSQRFFYVPRRALWINELDHLPQILWGWKFQTKLPQILWGWKSKKTSWGWKSKNRSSSPNLVTLKIWRKKSPNLVRLQNLQPKKIFPISCEAPKFTQKQNTKPIDIQAHILKPPPNIQTPKAGTCFPETSQTTVETVEPPKVEVSW